MDANIEEKPLNLNITLLCLFTCILATLSPLISIVPFVVAFSLAYSNGIKRLQKVVVGVTGIYMITFLIMWIVLLLQQSSVVATSSMA